jgi:lysophospholipase L1-like esterase
MEGFVPAPVFATVEAKRQLVNAWIRTSGEYDAVIDFDEITRDPSAPSRFLPGYDSGDHLHPDEAGYEVMGNAIDLELFEPRGSRMRR